MFLLKHIALCFSFNEISFLFPEFALKKRQKTSKFYQKYILKVWRPCWIQKYRDPHSCSIPIVGLSPLQYPKKSPTALSSSSVAESIRHILCNSNPNLLQLSIKMVIDFSSHICLVTGPPKCTELEVETQQGGRGEELGWARKGQVTWRGSFTKRREW